jgi:hypothetical protein
VGIVLSSVAERKCASRLPVLAVKEGDGRPLRRIVVATDFSSPVTPRRGRGPREAGGRRVHLVHAFDIPPW